MHSLFRSIARHSELIGRFAANGWKPAVKPQLRTVCTSSVVQKIHKKGHKDEKKANVLLEPNSECLSPIIEQMKNMEVTLCEELDKRLSLRTDLRLYEDFYVDCPDGKRHKLSTLGQISRKGTMIVINFSKNPSYASHTKNELQKFLPDVNVQQEGPFLHINVPQITRERRKEMVASVKASLIHKDYKTSLNKLYSTYSKKFDAIKDKDEKQHCLDVILHNKRVMEARAEELFKQREEKLLAEVV